MLEPHGVNIAVDGTTLGDGPLRRTIERALDQGDVRLSKTDDGWKVMAEGMTGERVKAAMRRSGYSVID